MADAEKFNILAFRTVNDTTLLDYIEKIRTNIGGHHPFIIVIVDSNLEGCFYKNLFGSHRAKSGIAVITTSNVENDIIKKGRMTAYFIYYFARYALSFIVPEHKNHEERKGCVFDRKINKKDITKSMKSQAFCDECRRQLLANDLSLPQFNALDLLFELSGNILNNGINHKKINETPIIEPRPVSKVKILILTSSPRDLIFLKLRMEIMKITSALYQSDDRDRFDIIQERAVQISDIGLLLIKYKPNIVHFSGHGNKLGQIIVEDESGNSKTIPIKAFNRLLSLFKNKVNCVVLNACYSEKQAEELADSIDYVIGMSNSISDDAAIAFSSAFYQALGFGYDIKTAFELGCIEIHLEYEGEENIPRLFTSNNTT
jgi:hypothetical protein